MASYLGSVFVSASTFASTGAAVDAAGAAAAAGAAGAACRSQMLKVLKNQLGNILPPTLHKKKKGEAN